MVEAWLIAPLSSLASILAGLYFYRYVNKQDSGTERMHRSIEAYGEGFVEAFFCCYAWA